MKTAENNSKERGNQKSGKKVQHSSYVDIGSPKVPIKQRKTTNKPQESLNDWSHAS
jgi:hypothetical protein